MNAPTDASAAASTSTTAPQPAPVEPANAPTPSAPTAPAQRRATAPRSDATNNDPQATDDVDAPSAAVHTRPAPATAALGRVQEIESDILDSRTAPRTALPNQAKSVAAESDTADPGVNAPQSFPAPRAAAGDPLAAAPTLTAAAPDEAPDRAAPLAARGLAALAQQKGGTIAMRLDPPSLGELRITMTVQHGSARVELQPTSLVAHELLNANLASLRDALERQGLVVERLTVHQPSPLALSREAHAAAAQSASAAPAEARSDGNASDRQHDRHEQRDGTRHDASQGQSRGRGEARDGDAGRHSPHAPRERRTFSNTFAAARGNGGTS